MAGLAEAVAQGRLQGLLALRDVLAAQVLASKPKETAALARQLRDVLRDIDELQRSQRKGSRVDELASKRASRVAGSSDQAPAKRRQRNSRS